MRRRVPLLIAATSAAALAIAPAWGASGGRTAQSESFFASGNAAAHWDNSQSDSDGDGWAQVYDVQDATSYAGTTLHHVEGLPAPTTAPSFDYKADRSGPSGGSPRLVMVFGDPAAGTTVGNIALTPQNWDTSWQHAQDGQWDVTGGTCVFRYQDNYQDAVSCMGAGTVVTSAFLVSDSGWLYPTGYKNWVDNVQYNGKTI